MCGLTAIFGRREVVPGEIEAMTSALAHRGPDASSVGIYDQCAFGHTRLAIIDLDNRSVQPMKCSRSKRYIVFNGEIYNYRELRSELSDYPFATQSDTEVILAAYDRWGKNCVHRFNGMFSFLIYCSETKELFGARDRFGIKPLFFLKQQDRVLFSSEVKAFQEVCQIEANEEYFRDYFHTGRRLNGSETAFKSVTQLRPGTSFSLSVDGGFDFYTWYDFPKIVTDICFTDIGHRHPEELLYDKLTQAVKYRVQSDVPVSVNFSGGLDSTLILYILGRELKQNDILVQTAISPDVDPADISYVSDIAASCGYDINYVQTGDVPFIKEVDLKGMMRSVEAPFKLSHFIDKCLAHESRKNGRTVILDGNGADESLFGYHAHVVSAFPDLFASRAFPAAVSLLLNGRNGAEARDYVLSTICRFLGRPRDELCCGWPIRETIRFFFENKLQSLLWFRDRSSMAHGTELRVPFLDHNVVEAMLALPLRAHIRGSGPKALISDILGARLDKRYVTRKKNSFLKPNIPEAFSVDAKKQIFDLGHAYLGRHSNSRQQVAGVFGRRYFERAGQVALWSEQFNINLDINTLTS